VINKNKYIKIAVEEDITVSYIPTSSGQLFRHGDR